MIKIEEPKGYPGSNSYPPNVSLERDWYCEVDRRTGDIRPRMIDMIAGGDIYLALRESKELLSKIQSRILVVAVDLPDLGDGVVGDIFYAIGGGAKAVLVHPHAERVTRNIHMESQEARPFDGSEIFADIERPQANVAPLRACMDRNVLPVVSPCFGYRNETSGPLSAARAAEEIAAALGPDAILCVLGRPEDAGVDRNNPDRIMLDGTKAHVLTTDFLLAPPDRRDA